MMRAILVDDERLALDSLEKLLSEQSEVEVIGKYRDPLLALEAARKERPDVVFFDINMPVLTGIEAAEQLNNDVPSADIVFVTAYDEYAVKAFEVNALDYVLKPVKRDRLVKTLQRLIDVRKQRPQVNEFSASPVFIRCFQTLQIEVDRGEPQSLRWRTAKAQELFAYLLYRCGQPVRKGTLMDLLWPDADWKKGLTQLYTTVYQMRKALEAIGVTIRIENRDEGYLLDLNGAELDVLVWERSIREAPALSEKTLPVHLKLLELYRGDFLAEYDYLWAESERERLRIICLKHAEQVSEQLAASRRFVEAIALQERMQQLSPHAENSYFSLMRLYDAIGDRHGVERQVALLTDMLLKEYGVPLKGEVLNWYRNWQEKRQ